MSGIPILILNIVVVSCWLQAKLRKACVQGTHCVSKVGPFGEEIRQASHMTQKHFGAL